MMLSNTVNLMNAYLKAIHCMKTNYFYEQDFIHLDSYYAYLHHYLSSCVKSQTVIYKNRIFHIDIKCIADERLDEITSISFCSKEINKENNAYIAEYIQCLLIEFSFFVSENLYQSLLESSTLKSFYHQTQQKLMLEHQRLRTNKALDIHNMLLIDPSSIKDLPYHIYLIYYINEEKILNISLLFDLYYQL
ncbi:MAG: hypothetical protein LUF02_01020 [Erysipelotrichaceae bacterium]|nr:hypothetical protein [Erysipelotrichaceae bacterium]